MRYSLFWGVAACLLVLSLDVWWDFTTLPSCFTTPPYARSMFCPSVVSAGTPTSNPLIRVVTDPAPYVKSRQNRDVLALFCMALGGALMWFLTNLGSVEKDFEETHGGRENRVIPIVSAITVIVIALLVIAFRVLKYRRFFF